MFGRRPSSRVSRIDAPGASDLIISATGVNKTYRTGSSTVAALQDVEFDVRRGEVVAVMGPSGCGKTSLLNCLSGLDEIDTGAIWLDGTNLASMSDRARTAFRARRMGFIFQVYNLLPVLSAVENVELPLLVAGVRQGDARNRAMAALARVGLEKWASHRPAELSGGQRQRVTIARSLVNRPALIWADEPTGALDSRTAHDIMELLLDLNREDGLTCVIVTHDPKIGSECDRIVQMSDGRVVNQMSHPKTSQDLIVIAPARHGELVMAGR